MTFAQQLKTQRDRLGLTQAEAARLLSVSASWVDKAERDQRAPHVLMQEGALARLAKPSNFSSGWTSAENPPTGIKGQWSRSVVVLMMSGATLRMAYFWDDKSDGGVWQRPKGLERSDRPLWWIDPPASR